MGKGYFDVPLNLPHAATIAARLVYHVQRLGEINKKEYPDALKLAEKLETTLVTYRFTGENPDEEESKRVVEIASAQLREFVDALEAARCGDDRLGQAVRNLFEVLELGREGARQYLRAGENPNSTLRPT
jgi:hypothetical protein